MMISNIRVLFIALLFSVNMFAFSFFDKLTESKSDAMPFGIISIPIPILDELGEEGNSFFDEFSTDVYSLYNNGIIQISNKYKVPVEIKDIAYRYNAKNILLIPNNENADQIEAIDSFYSELKNKGKNFLKQLAIKNKVVAIAFGHISNSQVKRAIKNGTLQFAIKIFLVQSKAIMYKTIKIEVESLATDPYYNPEDLVINIEKNVLVAYEKVILTIQQSGNVMESFSNEDSVDEEVIKEKEDTTSTNVMETASFNTKDNANKAFKELKEETSDDDW